MTQIKLTPAQLTYLRKLELGPQTCIETYAPANKLYQLGLSVKESYGRYGQMACTITDLGRDWLATHEGRK